MYMLIVLTEKTLKDNTWGKTSTKFDYNVQLSFLEHTLEIVFIYLEAFRLSAFTDHVHGNREHELMHNMIKLYLH